MPTEADDMRKSAVTSANIRKTTAISREICMAEHRRRSTTTERSAINDDLLEVEGIAGYLGVGQVTVYRWCREGRLSCMKAGKCWRIRHDVLDDFLRGSKYPSSLTEEFVPGRAPREHSYHRSVGNDYRRQRGVARFRYTKRG